MSRYRVDSVGSARPRAAQLRRWRSFWRLRYTQQISHGRLVMAREVSEIEQEFALSQIR